ncbi:LysM peptidoglycan-binding domain-containing protein [Ruicaihuangia caeni]|uniref:LysM peptidoglycan-binding domain-containing protein n=1 Tax=Ruicaihuangia caeni TaxID=3042517 RepID=UPI00338FC02C
MSASHRTIAPRTTAPRLRLTRRGRAVFTTLAAIPAVAGALVIGLQGGAATAGDTASGVTFSTVTVEAGESLWSIAERIAPSSDPRDVIYEIARLNQLESTDVQPGQQLAMPLAYAR